MNQEEADVVAKIVATADNNCTFCRDEMLEQLRKWIPSVEWRRFYPDHPGWISDESFRKAEPE